MKRRSFLQSSALGAAAITTIPLASCETGKKETPIPFSKTDDFELNEITIDELQQKIEEGVYTAEKIVQLYLDRIESVDKNGPALNSIMEINPDAQKVLVVSSDIPTITPEMVDWCVDTADQTEHEVYYNVITRQVMEARFPESNRSYVRLKDLEVCGGDMNVIHTGLITENNELWVRVVAARKNALKQALLVGIDNLILLLMRAIDLESAVQRVSKRLNIKGKAIQCPYAEIGMDVDKPHQLQIVRADLEQNINA